MTTSIGDKHRVTPITHVFETAHGDHDAEHDRARKRAELDALANHASSDHRAAGTPPGESTIVTLGTRSAAPADQDVLVYDYEPRTKNLVLLRQTL